MTKSQKLIAEKSRNLGAVVYEELRERILMGGMQDGDRVVIDRLAKEFGISVIPVREALARLSAERMLTFQENHGYRVAERPDVSDIAAWMEARLMVEQAAARLASKRITRLEIDNLRALNAKIASLIDRQSVLQTFIDLNNKFHALMVNACRNPHIVQCYGSLHYGPQVVRYRHDKGLPDLREITTEHERIITALSSGDSELAESEVTRHIMDGLSRLTNANADGDVPAITV